MRREIQEAKRHLEQNDLFKAPTRLVALELPTREKCRCCANYNDQTLRFEQRYRAEVRKRTMERISLQVKTLLTTAKTGVNC